MKKKYFKRALTFVLALAMLFTLSMAAFATEEVAVIVREANYDLNTHQFSYSPLDSFNSIITAGDTVYDVILGEYGSASSWIGMSGPMFLEGITINNTSYSSTLVEADDSCFDPDDDCTYIGGNAIIDSLNQLPEFIAYGGVDMSMARLFEDDRYGGYYFMGDGLHACSITYDWMYAVDFAGDDAGFVDSVPFMSSCYLSDGDEVRLTYGLVWMIFSI